MPNLSENNVATSLPARSIKSKPHRQSGEYFLGVNFACFIQSTRSAARESFISIVYFLAGEPILRSDSGLTPTRVMISSGILNTTKFEMVFGLRAFFNDANSLLKEDLAQAS